MPHIKAGDVNLYYELIGEGKETLVFVNGVGMTAAMWEATWRHLPSEKYRILVHDTRGQLMSEKPEMDYSMQMHADDLKALLDELGITEPVHLIGTSYGSEIAAIFALSWPERSKTLSMVTGVSELDKVLYYGVDTWAAVAEEVACGTCKPETFVRSMVPWSYSADFIANNEDFIQQRLAASSQLPLDFFAAFARLVYSFQKLDITDQLKKLKLPTLIVAAENDIIKPPRYSHIMQKEIAGSQYVEIAGSGHAVVLENPAALATALQDFLSQHTGN